MSQKHGLMTNSDLKFSLVAGGAQRAGAELRGPHRHGATVRSGTVQMRAVGVPRAVLP